MADPRQVFRRPNVDVSAVEEHCAKGSRCTLVWLIKAIAPKRSNVVTLTCTGGCHCVARLTPGGVWRPADIGEDFDPNPGISRESDPRAAPTLPVMDKARRQKIVEGTRRYYADLAEYKALVGIDKPDLKKFAKWRKAKGRD